MLWYFPYENDQESVPLDPHTMGRMLLMANRGLDGAATQNPAAAGGLRALTQLGGPTQVAAWQTQRHTQAAGGVGRKQPAESQQEMPELEAAGETQTAHGSMQLRHSLVDFRPHSMHHTRCEMVTSSQSNSRLAIMPCPA